MIKKYRKKCMQNYDIVVIGGGPGGYKCAIRSAQLGLKVACVDKNEILGGTCLRVGCIPSKALLHFSHEYYHIKNHLDEVGITCNSLSFNLDKIMSFKNKNITELSNGINYLFASNKIDRLCGVGKIRSINSNNFDITVTGNNGEEKITAKYVVIATGSEVASFPGIEIDEKNVVSSTAALSFKEVPKKLVVVGAGAIGLEMSSVWSRFGSEVTVVEFFDKIAPSMDIDISKALLASLKKQGINFKLSTKVTSIDKSSDNLTIHLESVKDGKSEIIEAEKVLISIGRMPYTDGLIDQNCIECDSRGFIKVNNKYETNIPGIFAIGDVIGGAMLAHKAEEEGIAVAELIAGNIPHVDYDIIPSVIYTHPAVASIGKTEESLKNINYAYNVGKSNFSANSRSKITNNGEGFVKVLTSKENNAILGVHIIGAYADTIINEAAIAMAYRASSEDVFRISHSHPDVNEAFKDACEAAYLK
ncbi:dihydrolipoyl dehydrogenase [Ehrlichia ruminantium]|uniref:Dihydrolipoyl dehydrogenase n=2 Tax=Ehrlichia ruminantium TaxID=779 RepID=A0A0H3LZH3_EHRRW|nr:dihydrolipoyl dehydrogenase [Ehrlichia ruminantium]CAI27032.1 Dihydrolipoamide dehydrogenase [Ehrlichia ruminantium str. Welgevonden]QLK51516.1 dihydrolipoyl dehydrogenase [Ehrlichia ruminantium]QLK53351.1 dihydrolipoyl dehydrogenase [Ehrlichia ruminantium]QLK55191.1 dihydrolipoyl dehydrogenase [Ehrlichia ruminantium]